MSAYEKQVGGDHYRGMAIQPMEYILANKLGFAEGTAIAYISRWESKGGVQDLEKAIHTLQLLIEHTAKQVKPQPAVSEEEARELRRMATEATHDQRYRDRYLPTDAKAAEPSKIVDYPVVFSAPQGWGKTARGEELAKEFGCTAFGDVPSDGSKLVGSVLYFANTMAANVDGGAPVVGNYRGQLCRVVSRGWKMQADFDTGPPATP